MRAGRRRLLGAFAIAASGLAGGCSAPAESPVVEVTSSSASDGGVGPPDASAVVPQVAAPSSSAEQTIESPSPPPTGKLVERDHDCDSGEIPRVCVSPSQTTGSPMAGGPCRESPKQDLCRGCRPVFVSLTKGQCCYEGLSRFPRCKE